MNRRTFLGKIHAFVGALVVAPTLLSIKTESARTKGGPVSASQVYFVIDGTPIPQHYNCRCRLDITVGDGSLATFDSVIVDDEFVPQRFSEVLQDTVARRDDVIFWQSS